MTPSLLGGLQIALFRQSGIAIFLCRRILWGTDPDRRASNNLTRGVFCGWQALFQRGLFSAVALAMAAMVHCACCDQPFRGLRLQLVD